MKKPNPCGHASERCDACEESYRAFSAFLATNPSDGEKREWLMSYARKVFPSREDLLLDNRTEQAMVVAHLAEALQAIIEQDQSSVDVEIAERALREVRVFEDASATSGEAE